MESKEKNFRCEQGSNLRGHCPSDFKSDALTTRPSQLCTEKKWQVYKENQISRLYRSCTSTSFHDGIVQTLHGFMVS